MTVNETRELLAVLGLALSAGAQVVAAFAIVGGHLPQAALLGLCSLLGAGMAGFWLGVRRGG